MKCFNHHNQEGKCRQRQYQTGKKYSRCTTRFQERCSIFRAALFPFNGNCIYWLWAIQKELFRIRYNHWRYILYIWRTFIFH